LCNTARQAKGWRKEKSLQKKKKKFRNKSGKLRLPAPSPSPVTQLITRTPCLGLFLPNVTIAIGIEYFLECTCSDSHRTTTVKKISVLNLERNGPRPVSSHPRLLPYSTETIQDITESQNIRGWKAPLEII